MSMQGDGSRRVAGGAESGPRCRPPWLVGRPIVRLALCLSLSVLAAGCAAIGQALGPTALGPAAAARDVSIAFESIDGLPRDVSQRLTRALDEEASALRIAVVPAGAKAAYRMRGYVAAHAEGPTTSIAWAWDVYDAELHRAFRLSGQERAGATAGRTPSLAAADDALLRRIARAGMEQLADFLASAPVPAAPAPPAPEPTGSVVASRDDPAAEPPLPHRRPALAGLTRTDRLAAATFGR
jgi:hypothetical protein